MMIVIKRHQNASQMRQRPSENQYMKDVMRTPHKVESTRSPSFRYSEGVDERASDIDNALKDKPAPAHLDMRLRDAVLERRIGHGQDPRKAECEEHACSKGIPRGMAKARN